jgi:hypothetical protein
MITLLAGDLADGWAYVKQEEQFYVIRPPYRHWCKTTIDEHTIEKAVADYGFEVLEGEFENWDGLIGFLKVQFVKTRKERGHSIPDRVRMSELIQKAPKDILWRYLDRIEKELIPNGEWDATLSLLTDLMNADNVKQDSELDNRVRFVMKSFEKAKLAAQNAPRKCRDDGRHIVVQFPDISNQCKDGQLSALIRTISNAKQVLPLTG